MGLELGLIGFPIKHSLSPWIHEQFMEKTNVDGRYLLYETEREQLKQTVDKLRQIGADGFNITVPYKQEIIPYLDDLHPDAEKIGAVNTVVNHNGKWKGYNTDGLGYVKSVKESYPAVFKPNKKVLVLGAGGAARGIYRALVQEAFLQVDIANRTYEKAEQLLNLKTEMVKTNILTFKEAENQLSNYDYIVQTTSVGMKPQVDEKIVSLINLKENAVVSDIVYQPLETALLREAKVQKGHTHQGHAMLLYQAQLAFELWTGHSVQLDDILIRLEKRLRGNQ